jgi:hypothetical protein
MKHSCFVELFRPRKRVKSRFDRVHFLHALPIPLVNVGSRRTIVIGSARPQRTVGQVVANDAG